MDSANSNNDAGTPPSDEGKSFEKSLEDMEKRVHEKISQTVATGMSTLEDSLTTKLTTKKDDDKMYDWGTGDDDDETISKKDLPKIISEVTKNVNSETKKTLEEKTKKSERDCEAMSDFPAQNKRGDRFNKRFYDEVNKEINHRVRRGRSSEDIDLIYDASAAVAVRGQREGWYAPEEYAKQTNVQRNARGDSFSVTGRPTEKSGPTEGQLTFAAKAGLSKEALAKQLERMKKKT